MSTEGIRTTGRLCTPRALRATSTWRGFASTAAPTLKRRTRSRAPLYIAVQHGHIDAVRLCLDRGADVERAARDGLTSLHVASIKGQIDTARLLLERGAEINRVTDRGTPHDLARKYSHAAMAAWLARVEPGWSQYLSEPRYKLVVLRALVASDRAWRQREDSGKELLLDFLFPGAQPQATKPRLPNSVFPRIARYYWCGQP